MAAPAGEHVVEFRFHSSRYTHGLAISLHSLIVLSLLIADLPSRIRLKKV